MLAACPAAALALYVMVVAPVAGAATIGGGAPAAASFRFSNTHGDHMVLQQAPAKAQVWGFGTAGQSVSVVTTAAGGATPVKATVAADGTWQVALAPVKASVTPVTVTATSGTASIALKDVLYGDVWFCSGQSNMQFTVDNGFNASAEVAAAANFPNIRLFTAGNVPSLTPLTELAAKGGVAQPWSIASPASVGGGNWTHFSAVCWFFGRDTYIKQKYPIGLIASDWGGTRDEAWMDQASLKSCNTSSGLLQAVGQTSSPPLTSARSFDFSGISDSYRSEISPEQGSVLFNGMVHPFIRSTIFGAIWYQGESDCNGLTGSKHKTSTDYACTFPTMIASWRSYWSTATKGATAKDFPFGFMQLSTWGDHQNKTCGDRQGKVNDDSCDVAVVRWGQSANVGSVPNAKMPNTFMAVAVDLGDPASPFGDIHPRYKQQMAARLALSAQAVAYNSATTPLSQTTGPLATVATAVSGSNSSVKIDFKNAKTLSLKHHVGFEVSAKPCDMSFPEVDTAGWTEVPITGSAGTSVTITGSGAGAAPPKCVRYNWYQAACMPAVGPELCAIYGDSADWTLGDTLPAPPFIMDVK